MHQPQLLRPRVTLLNQEQQHMVHERSLEILARAGVRVDSAPARRLFDQASQRSGVSSPVRTGDGGRRLYIGPELVAWALEAAPSSVDIFRRDGNLAFRLGADQARFAIGVTALYYQDPLDDAATPFTRQHMALTVRLGQALPSFDAVSTIGIVQDVPPELSDLYATLEMTANTTKPLVVLVSDEERFPDVLDMLEHLHGDLAARPFLIPYLNPISPLVINQGTVDKMLAAIGRGLPFIYSNYGMAGASTPITPAGTLAMLNAELLAGLVLTQLIQPGAPVILGSLPAYFDMQGMGSFYDPLSYVINLACAEMMRFYGLPHCGTSGSGMGWGGDLIAAGHQWANHLLSCLSTVGLVPFVGDNLGAKTYSPTIAVLANEIIARARLLAGGFAADDAAFGVDEIVQVGPGGNFLTAPLTLQGFRQAYFKSDIWPNLTLEAWQEQGCPRADDRLRRVTQERIDAAQPPSDHADLLDRGDAFIRR